MFAERLVALGWFELIRNVETDMVWYRITDPRLDDKKLCLFLQERGVMTWTNSRFVIHHHIREEQIEKVLKLLSEWRATQ